MNKINMYTPIRLTLPFLFVSACVYATQKKTTSNDNDAYWQQHVSYKMDVDINVKNYRYSGLQKLVYTNNSPDTLYRVFYHLYPNAFQPGSEMDIRSQTIADPDKRVKDRISKLTPDEIGYLKVIRLTQDGDSLKYHTEGTILEVPLKKPILPGTSTVFDMKFEGQVPVQIRRSGRNNKEDIALSMTQWYPKMAEYDFEGWHPDPYIGREFYGVWGDFDVTLHIDRSYVVGGTGYIQNPQEVGHGYQILGKPLRIPKGKKLTWHFYAPRVHDFAWAADPDYIHDVRTLSTGTQIHFFYKNKPEIIEVWDRMKPIAVKGMEFYNKYIGPYPYKQYSIIQGGDGGMEYAMCTLITGNRKFESLVGVMLHEMAHSWFQQVLATNESKHAWMDEGFTSFVEALATDKLLKKNEKNPFQNAYRNYIYLALSGYEEPLTTHADHFNTNMAYGMGSYSKGEIFLSQLAYIVGIDNLKKILQRYYAEWKFKHPTPNDFKRVAEKTSNLQLDWYLNEWIGTTHTIDYAIKKVTDTTGTATHVTLKRIGPMPMPLDILVTYTDGNRESFHIPLKVLRGHKKNDFPATDRTVLKDWGWANPMYEFTIPKPKDSITSIVIDPLQLTADTNIENNLYKRKE